MIDNFYLTGVLAVLGNIGILRYYFPLSAWSSHAIVILVFGILTGLLFSKWKPDKATIGFQAKTFAFYVLVCSSGYFVGQLLPGSI